MSNPGLTSLAKTAAFTANSVTANLTDLLGLTDGEGGDAMNLTTDNAQTVNAMFVDSIQGQIVVTCSDIELTKGSGAAALVIGATGSLVIAYARRTQGKGFVSGHTMTITYANAQLRGIQREAGVTGTGKLTLTFGAYDPAGSAVQTAAVA
jgi:hypothetical protein